MTGPAAAEFTRFLVDEADPSWPRDNWRELAEAGTAILFGTLAPDDSEAPALVVTVRNAAGTWQAEDYGACTPAVLLEERVGPATWTPGQDINETTFEFEALVTERACASGQSSEGRVVQPRVVSTPTSVTIIFGVGRLEGPQDCQGNEASRYPVRLPEPLGDRELLDGGVYPAQEVDLTP